MFPESSHSHSQLVLIVVLDFVPRRTLYTPVPENQDSTFLNEGLNIFY